MKYSGHGKSLCKFSKLSKLNAFNLLGCLTNTDASILVYKIRPERTSFNIYATTINLPLVGPYPKPFFAQTSTIRRSL